MASTSVNIEEVFLATGGDSIIVRLAEDKQIVVYGNGAVELWTTGGHELLDAVVVKQIGKYGVFELT